MNVEEVKSKQRNKIYRAYLIRESYKVKVKDINISAKVRTPSSEQQRILDLLGVKI